MSNGVPQGMRSAVETRRAHVSVVLMSVRYCASERHQAGKSGINSACLNGHNSELGEKNSSISARKGAVSPKTIRCESKFILQLIGSPRNEVCNVREKCNYVSF